MPVTQPVFEDDGLDVRGPDEDGSFWLKITESSGEARLSYEQVPLLIAVLQEAWDTIEP